jgi:ribose transport system substrate-binding protein
MDISEQFLISQQILNEKEKIMRAMTVFLRFRYLIPAGLMLFFLAAPGLLRAAEEDRVKIVVSVPLASHGWTGAVIRHAREEISRLSQKYSRVGFILVTANSPEKQADDLRAMLDEGVRGLVVLPVSDEPLVGVLEEAHKKGVFIVAVDRISPHLARDVLVTADNQTLGRQCGQIVARALGGRGKIAIMEALPSSINTLRVEAFKEVLAAYPEISIVDSRPVNWNPVIGLEVMEKYLQEHPHLDAIWTGDDNILVRVLGVYRQSGRRDLKVIVGLGGAKEVLKMILDGEPLVPATIYYPAAIISDSIRVAAEHLLDGRQFEPEIAIDCELVDQKNVRDFYDPDSLY